MAAYERAWNLGGRITFQQYYGSGFRYDSSYVPSDVAEGLREDNGKLLAAAEDSARMVGQLGMRLEEARRESEMLRAMVTILCRMIDAIDPCEGGCDACSLRQYCEQAESLRKEMRERGFQVGW